MENPASKSMNEIQTEMLKGQIKTIKEQFQKLDKLDVRTIPEAIFVHHFLPVFSGERKENAQESLAMWVNIAGSNFHPVNIVNPKGEVVAQVPPLQNNAVLDPSSSKSNLSYAVQESNARAGLSPLGSQTILTNQLTNKLNALTSEIDAKNVPHEKMWKDLLTKYGKGPKNTQQKEINNQAEGDPFGF